MRVYPYFRNMNFFKTVQTRLGCVLKDVWGGDEWLAKEMKAMELLVFWYFGILVY